MKILQLVEQKATSEKQNYMYRLYSLVSWQVKPLSSISYRKVLYGGAIMKPKTLKILLLIQSVAMVLVLGWLCLEIIISSERTTLICENSPDGAYTLLVHKSSKILLFHPIDHIQVVLCDNDSVGYKAFDVDISDFARCEIEWEEDGVRIVLHGQEALYYTLPFRVETEQ